MIYKNDLILRTLACENVERPPVWLMRQAGRILPQYRAVRERLSGFKELVTTPELVAEVTVQPVDELDVDAAIIFSDILVIPECMGLDYEMIEKKGPMFPRTISTEEDIAVLNQGEEAAERLDYVYKGIEITKGALSGRVPLIGFSGSPFTLLCYMVEGSGSKTFSKAKRLLYTRPKLAHMLLEKITATTIAYLNRKIDSGVDLVQLFDSWAGVLSGDVYRTFAIPYIKKISDAIMPRVPVIVFSKGAWFSLNDLDKIGSSAIGLDWNIDPQYARSICGKDKVLQGNLDPCVLYGDSTMIREQALQMVQSFGRNHIANLGHGVYPDTPLDGVKCFVDTIKSFSY